MKTLHVRFDRPERVYYPGDVITGKVELHADKDFTCTSLSCDLMWYAHGVGNTRENSVESKELASGHVAAGTHEYPFSFELPPGPYTWRGETINLDWGVKATADIPWARDPSDRADFVLAVGPVAAPPEPMHAQDALMTENGVGGVIIGVVALLFGVGMIGVAFVGEGDAFCCGLISLIAGFVFFTMGMHRFMAARMVGEVRFSCEPWPLHPGQTLTHMVTFTPQMSMRLSSMKATLTGKEIAIQGYGTDKTTYTHTFYEREVQLCGQGSLPSGQEAVFVGVFELPEDAPYSFQCADNRFVWEINTHMDIPMWPDWDDTHALEVSPDYEQLRKPANELLDAPTGGPEGPAW
ncbi:MAG: hypothetical protein AAGI01_02425 [Myxococcota bacterium]